LNFTGRKEVDIPDIQNYLEQCSPILKFITVNLIATYIMFSVLFRLNNLIKKNTQKSILMWLKFFAKGILSTFILPPHIPEWTPSRGLAKGINYSFAAIWFIGSFLFFFIGLIIFLATWYSQKPIPLIQSFMIFGLNVLFLLGSRFFYVEARKSIALAQNSQIIQNNSET